MKVSASPRTGKISNQVFYPSRFGLCARELVIPRDGRSPAQVRMRYNFGAASQEWSRSFSEDQRQRWIVAAQSAPSHPSLGEYSNLSGQQFCVQINSTLRCIGQAPLQEPPMPVVFSPNPVGALTAVNDPESGLRLLLNVGAVTENIMVFGQAPCSAGRMKHRRVCYLGLLGPTTGGISDIAALYTARFGQPAPGQKVFIVTCQERNGWKGQDHVTSAIIPPLPLPNEQQSNQETKAEAAAPGTPEAGAAPAKATSSLSRAMYKGSTPDAPGMHTGLVCEHPVSILGTSLVHGLRAAMAALRTLGVLSAGRGVA
jgi:hypothetical protein